MKKELRNGMQELEKILEEIIKKSFCVEIRKYESETVVLLDDVEEILEKHMNDGWITVENPPEEELTGWKAQMMRTFCGRGC